MLNVNPKWLALAGAFAMIFMAFVWLWVSRANLLAKVAQVSARQTLCLQANEEWEDKAKIFQSRMRQLKQESDRRQARLAGALQKAEREAQGHIKEAERLMKKTKPAAESDCEAALSLLHTYVAARQREAGHDQP